jgi:hypothetical protein
MRISCLILLWAEVLCAQPAASSVKLAPSPQKFVTFYPVQARQVPAALREEAPVWPLAGVTAAASAGDVLWVGTPSGLVRYQPSAGPRDRIQFFASRRYLPDDSVVALQADAGGVWVRTQTGGARIDIRTMTLAEKAGLFEARVAARHDRHGMVASSRLAAPGDLASNRTVSSDNDGLWTAMYAAAECFRYAVTGSPEALARARRATDAVLHLVDITGRPGFPARSWINASEVLPRGGTWHKLGDGRQWKADTSSDEIVGHFFLYQVAYDLLPDAELRKRVRDAARRIMDHILDHGLYLVDVNGKPTTWGRWAPEYFATPGGRPDGPLNAVELLMFLRVTHHLTGDARYEREYRRVAFDLGYARLATRYLELREELNYSDEELAMLSFYPLFVLEKDPQLLSIYRQAVDQWWQNIQRELNPLWTFIYAVGQPSKAADLAGAVWTLQRIPNDLVAWTVRNSARADVRMAPAPDRHGRAEALTLLPPDERPVMKWNGNPFVVDGGCDGCSEDDGTFFLLPYWLGRYHRLLTGE